MTRIRIVLSVLLACVSTVSGQTISGIVLDQNTQRPVPYASVYLVDFEIGTISDTAGVFRFSTNLPSKLKIKFSASGYESKLETYDFSKGIFVINLSSKHLNLEEVTISSSKSDLQKNNVIHIETRKLSDLNAISSTTLGEAIASIPGVYQSSTGIGISKPVIRGLQGIRVITLLNGLRIENQQWGGDHGLGLTELGIGSVEVIKGPSSLLYGADALGGVVYFKDDTYAKYNTTEVGGKAQVESNTLGTSNQVWFKSSKNNLRLNLAASLSSHADYKLANGKFADNSRFQENGVKVALGYNKKRWVINGRYTYIANRVGIPGHTHDTLVNYASFQVLEQKRNETIPAQTFNNHYISVENKWFFKRHELNVLVGQTLNRLKEFEDKVTIPGMDMMLSNTIYSIGLKSQISPRLKWVNGLQGMFQSNKNGEKAIEQLIPNSRTQDNGVYSIAYYALKKWNFQGGLRWDIRSIKTNNSGDSTPNFARNYTGVNFSVGGVRSATRTTIRTSLSSGFRAPHLSELLADGFHHGALRYEIGDRNLIPEKATQLDMTFEFHQEHIEWIVNPFFTTIRNYIAIQPMDSIIDGLPVFNFVQVDKFQLFGVDLAVHYHPHFAHFAHFESTLSLLNSSTNDGTGIALQPQNRWSNLIRLTFNSNRKVRLQDVTLNYTYFARQDRIATYETATPAYHLLHAALSFNLKSKPSLVFHVGVKNCLNTGYIDHLSRLKNIELQQPGRNFYLSVKYNFIK
jgi:iron complex outermembrane receptor protein